MLRRFRIRVAIWLFADAAVAVNVKGVPVWFLDQQRIDVDEFPQDMGLVIPVRACGKPVRDTFTVVGIPDQIGGVKYRNPFIGEANAQS